MSQETIINDLQSYFTANYSETTIVYQNKAFEPQIDNEYTRFDIYFASDVPLDIGPKKTYRQNGFIDISLYLNENTGSDRSSQIADILTGLFRTKTINKIKTNSPEHDYIGNENGFYRYNFQVSFNKDIQEI